MFSAQAMNLAKGDHRFQLSEHDVLTPLPRWTGRHVVRAMNILNRSYFGAEQIGLILSHVHDGLGEGGWLITGSNQDAGSQVHGGVYERTESGFRKVWGSGEGSPVEPEILRWQPTRV
jgi:chemotaxis methyl-accepting protein methylase